MLLALDAVILVLAGFLIYRAHLVVVLEHGRISAVAWPKKVIWSESLDSLESALITQSRGNYSIQLLWPHDSHRVELWDSLREKLAIP